MPYRPPASTNLLRAKAIFTSPPKSRAFSVSSIMSNTYVKRTTLFKVPKEEDIDAVLEQYAILRKNAVKVGNIS